jgi:uncharacterized protein
VRVEHPQRLIDAIQYGRAVGTAGLPPASYSISSRTSSGDSARGVYSFCMCPGGLIVPSATEVDGICTNGMSASKRSTPHANAALVVTVEPRDFGWRFGDQAAGWNDDPDEQRAARHPVLLGAAFQRRLEQRAAVLGGGAQRAPAQRFDDFLAGRPSSLLPVVSYRPGVTAGEVGAALPPFVVEALRAASKQFAQQLRGFTSSEATLVAVETRTSAPVRILRSAESLESPSVDRLYPCGEGAGYAGGITSSALDGWRVADAVLARLLT